MQNAFPELEHKLKQFMLNAPRVAGLYAVEHFKDNIRQRGGLPVGGRLEKFKERQYELQLTSGKPILMRRGNLVDSIRLISVTGTVAVVGIDNPGIEKYAAVHQNGGDIPVTPKMKSYFWAQYYNNAQYDNNGVKEKKSKREWRKSDAEFWKCMALKKEGSKIHIPKRRYMDITPDLQIGMERQLISYAKQLGLM